MKLFKPADILIPQNADFSKWSVVACDQYTSQSEYWKEVESIAGDAPSALKIVFPEVYLTDGRGDERIRAINDTMKEYLDTGLFEELKHSMVYVKRTQRDGRIRCGVVGMVDLEAYDFSKGSQSPIRATEGTVLERIPPRVKIRRNASLELPHILLLINDRERTVVEPLEQKKDSMRKLYDFDLMMNSGHLTGYQLTEEELERVDRAIDHLAEKAGKTCPDGKGALVFAVGDGNHSLATAKTCWENLKKTLSGEEQKTHPARYALVEVMNIHDAALEFEPIHRVVFGVDTEKLLCSFRKYYPESAEQDNGGQRIAYQTAEKTGVLYVKNAPCNLAVGTLQKFLDQYIQENGGEVDYIHGADVVAELSEKPGNIGFLLPAMSKDELFETIIRDGALPRKTFSMGEAQDKRFYMEAKRI